MDIMDMTDEVDKQLYGTTWINTIAYKAMSARNRVHFPDDKSLEQAKAAVTKAIELKQTTTEIISLLKDEQAANDIVLKDNQERYTRYLNGRTHTLELEQTDGNVKWFYGLASRHKDYKDFLDTQLKRFEQAEPQAEQTDPKTETPKTIDPTGKPWESDYDIVCTLCENFYKHFQILVSKRYITEDNNTLAWDYTKASKKDLAHYFKAIKQTGNGKRFWRHIVCLFGMSPIIQAEETMRKYAGIKNYSSDKLVILFALVGLNKG